MQDNCGVYHVHRFHMKNKDGYILCGMVSNVRLQWTTKPDVVNCKLCLKKMAKVRK